MLLSVRDVSDELVALSLNALATLVPLLGGDVVIGSERHQLFGRGQPKVGYTSEYLSTVFANTSEVTISELQGRL